MHDFLSGFWLAYMVVGFSNANYILSEIWKFYKTKFYIFKWSPDTRKKDNFKAKRYCFRNTLCDSISSP